MRSDQEAYKHSMEGMERKNPTGDVGRGRWKKQKGMRTKATVGEDEVMRRKKVGRKGEMG